MQLQRHIGEYDIDVCSMLVIDHGPFRVGIRHVDGKYNRVKRYMLRLLFVGMPISQRPTSLTWVAKRGIYETLWGTDGLSTCGGQECGRMSLKWIFSITLWQRK